VAVASLGAVAAAVTVTPAAANPTNLLGPVPATNVGITFTTPVTGALNGTTITFHADATTPNTLTSYEAKVCAHQYGADPDLTRYTSYNTTSYGYDGTDNTAAVTDDVRCVYPAGITGGTSLTGSNYRIPATGLSPGSTTTGSQSLTVGTGTVTWNSTNGFGQTLTCDATHLCDVVVRIGVAGGGPANTWFIQPIQFAAAPNAPTALTGADSSGQTILSWTAPTQGAPFTNYQVNVTPHPTSGPCSSGTCLTGSTTPGYTLTGLTNFTPYSITVQAVNALTTGPVSNTYVANPATAGPTGLTTSSGDSQVLFSWGAVSGATGYNVFVSPAPGAGPCATGTCTGNPQAGTSLLVTGLQNSHTYTFSVSANVPGGTTTQSSTTGTPNANFIQQQINVDRPVGVLVVSQYCSGNPQDLEGRFDPSNNSGGFSAVQTPNTLCSLQLSGPRPSGLLTDAITANPRYVHDLVTHGTDTVESANAVFQTNDLNQLVTGTGIPAGTRIKTVISTGQVQLTNVVTGSFDGGDLNILGTTVNFGSISGNTITGVAHGELAVPNEIEGYQIPGGSHITNVVSGSTVDISAPADDQSSNLTVRIWTTGPTPAHLLETGPHQGQYFEAQGQIRQVMLADTRAGADTGWTVTGQVSQFCDTTVHTQCFSGDDLGWTPKGVHDYSQPVSTPDGPYSMSPANGGPVAPGTFALGTGSTLSTDSTVPGSVPGATLAYANTGHGLGLAALDADLLLWIPTQVKSGHYQATLTFTAI
jgi:hypothetical protein